MGTDLADMEVVIFPATEGDGDARVDRVSGGAPPATPGGGQPLGGGEPPDPGLLADGMETLKEAEEDVDEVDPNMPDLLVCND